MVNLPILSTNANRLKQEDGKMSTYEALQDKMLLKLIHQHNYGSPLDQDIDPKLAVEMAKKTKQANKYKKYVQGKEKGYIEDNSSDYMSNQAIKPDPSNIMDFNRFVVGEEIARGGKRGSKAYKHHLNVSKVIKAGKKLAKGRGY